MPSADPRKWERLETHIAQLGLPVAGPFARWMGCRPTLPDYLPAIGRSARLDNLFYAFGISIWASRWPRSPRGWSRT
jgi:D-amino-acid dehydrogenase